MKFISIYLFSTVLLLLAATGVNEIDSNTTVASSDQLEVESLNLETLGSADLVATNFRCSLPFGSGPCPGGPRADGTCNGGTPPSFFMGVTIVNQGNIGLAPGVSFKIQWRAVPAGTIVQTVTTPSSGLPPGGSFTVRSPTLTMPCPAGPPFALNSGWFGAFVDFGNNITECDETNNASAPFPVCHN